MADKKLWLQGAKKKMEEKGSVGSFTKDAKKVGKSVHALAEKDAHSKKVSPVMKKKAVFALNMEKIAKGKKK